MNTQNPDVQLKHDPTINVLANNSNTGGWFGWLRRQ